MYTNILEFLVGAFMALCIILFIALKSRWNVRLNYGFVRITDYDKVVEPPKIDVEKVEIDYACNTSDRIAKYYCRAWYKKKKDVDCQDFVFYDAVGKYNVGDVIELTKSEKK